MCLKNASSDVEGGNIGEKGKRKERPKTKRKKTDKGMPRLSIQSIEQDGEVVECQLETGKHSVVSFKFNRDDDQPEDIAHNLVKNICIPFIFIMQPPQNQLRQLSVMSDGARNKTTSTA